MFHTTAFLKRALTGAAAFAMAVAGFSGAGQAANNKGFDTIPLTITNNTGYDGDIYVYAWGQWPAQAPSTWYYVTNADGDVSTYAYMPTYENVGFSIGSGKSVTIQIPQLVASRVYFSLGKPMKIVAGTTGAPSTPSGWTKGGPNMDTVFDWFEYSWEPAGNTDPFLNGNTTQVDMLGLPMKLTFSGDGPPPSYKSGYSQTRGFTNPNARSKIFAAIQKKNVSKQYRRLLLAKKAKIPTRIISPYNGIKYGVFNKNQLSGYINSVWKKYRRAHMVATTTAGTPANQPAVTYKFLGKVRGNRLTFDRVSPAPAVNNVATFMKPTSQQAFQGWGPTQTYPAGSAEGAQAAALGTFLQAGLMRTTILKKANISACPKNTKKAYYRNKPVNFYSKIIHLYALKHQAYGFGYDDMCNQASDMQVFNPTGVKVTLLPLD